MAVGWYLHFFHCSTGRRGTLLAERVLHAYHDRLEVGSALRPRNQSAPALKAQADK
jgi:hypothetical protein